MHKATVSPHITVYTSTIIAMIWLLTQSQRAFSNVLMLSDEGLWSILRIRSSYKSKIKPKLRKKLV